MERQSRWVWVWTHWPPHWPAGLFPSWLGAGALMGLWIAGATPGQWRPPNDPVDDG